MRLKRWMWGIMTLAVLSTSASCKKTDDDNTVVTTKITSFYLKNDSIEGLSDIEFTIDNDSNVIYNKDSAEYGIRVDSVWPIIGASSLESITINDTLDYSREDTVFMDFTKPVTIRTVSAADPEQKRTYTVKVKVHQVDPDTFIWNALAFDIYAENPTSERAVYLNDEIKLLIMADKARCYSSPDGKEWTGADATGLPQTFDADHVIASGKSLYYGEGEKLYSSTDGAAWEETTLTDISINTMLFYMEGYLYAHATMGGETCIARCEEGSATWERASKVPAGFPVRGAGLCVADGPTGKPRAFLAGGVDAEGNLLNSLWSTEDGEYWTNLTLGGKWFTPREGIAIVQYAGGLMMFGGKDADGICYDDFHLYSPDYGLTWETPDSKAQITIPYERKYYISPITLSDGYIYLVGGRASDNGDFAKNVLSGLNYASLPGFKK